MLPEGLTLVMLGRVAGDSGDVGHRGAVHGSGTGAPDRHHVRPESFEKGGFSSTLK